MKEVLIATDGFLPRWDGVARFLSEIIPGLAKKYKITVVAPDYKGKKYMHNNVTVVRIPLRDVTIGDYTPSVIDAKKIKRLVEHHDIVFVQSLGPIGAPAVYYGRKFKKKVVAFMHSVEWELVSSSLKRYKRSTYVLVKKMVQYLYKKCDVIIFPSEEIKQHLDRIKVKKKIVHVGTNSNYFKPGVRNKAKKKIGINGDSFVIGYVGRIGREKDLLTLERAYFHLKKQYPNLELLIVGDGVAEVVRQLKKTGVQVVGCKDNVLPYYQAMDVYVLPSLTETSSLSTMEAMSCGLPVIVTPVGFLKSYIIPGVNGLLFHPKDVKQLIRKLEILINDSDVRKKLGKNARQTIIDKFSWEKTVKEIGKVLG